MPAAFARPLPVATAILLCAALAAQTPDQTAIMITVTTSTAPPSLTFTWPLDASAIQYTVARRPAGANSWMPANLIPGGGAVTTWTDPNVAVGERYEYWFTKSGNPLAKGLVTAGVEARALEDRGIVVLVVESNKVQTLGVLLDRLTTDLVGDGWTVLRHDVPITDPAPLVKALITADAAAQPGQVQAVFLLGHVPVPYSGAINPDGHPDHFGAWPADAYYGDLDGVWTDASVNTSVASRPQNRNVPGDGKFDQSSLPSSVELQVGRVDLIDMPSFPQGEDALLRQYLDKDHDYRHKVFAADPLAMIDDNFGYFSGEAFAASGWRNFAQILGAGNIVVADYFTALNTTTGPSYVWSYGCGGGWYQGAGGIGSTSNFVTSQNRGVFTMLFGSYFGDWDSTDNFLRAPLCSGWTLADAWAGRPHWEFQPLALGETLGFCARLSQNDTASGGYGTRFVHVALMGDPTLRQHVIAPPGSVVVTDAWPQANVTWTPSVDAVAGHHVYRSASPYGPFVRLSQAPVVGGAFTDAAPSSGSSTYMVRAIRLETTPSGSYWNLSQGAFATQSLPTQAAAHTRYGSGCYRLSDSCYQYFATPVAARQAQNGGAITLTPSGGGYLLSHGGVYLPPSTAATPLALGDDSEVAVVPSQPMTVPGGSAAVLYVHSNGIVATAPLSLSAPASAEPAVAACLAEPATAWYCWHDYDPSEAGSGSIVTEEVAGTLYVTWDGVESHPAGVANPSTLQLQFELGTGVVRYVFVDLAAVGSGQSTAPSEQHLIGFSPGGASVDAGPIDFATGLPLTLGTANLEALALTAGPAPVSTPTAGTLLSFTLDHMPATAPNGHVGVLVFSVVPDLVGTPLAALGMPGCSNYLGSIDALRLVAGVTPSQTTTLQLPAGVPGGFTFATMALALMPPNSLPNGQNAMGLLSSNGVLSFVNGH